MAAVQRTRSQNSALGDCPEESFGFHGLGVPNFKEDPEAALTASLSLCKLKRERLSPRCFWGWPASLNACSCSRMLRCLGISQRPEMQHHLEHQRRKTADLCFRLCPTSKWGMRMCWVGVFLMGAVFRKRLPCACLSAWRNTASTYRKQENSSESLFSLVIYFPMCLECVTNLNTSLSHHFKIFIIWQPVYFLKKSHFIVLTKLLNSYYLFQLTINTVREMIFLPQGLQLGHARAQTRSRSTGVIACSLPPSWFWCWKLLLRVRQMLFMWQMENWVILRTSVLWIGSNYADVIWMLVSQLRGAPVTLRK